MMRVLVLGAGFGGLELCTLLSESLGNEIDVTLIDGAGRIGRVDVDFFSDPSPTGVYHEPTLALRSEKEHFGSSRRARWFGL
jgi:hypothetical protein